MADLLPMKKVILLRHAKSSWDNPDLDDHDRPLNARGRSAAPVIAEWLGRKNHLPTLVLCSTSARTRETLSLMEQVRSVALETHFLSQLYHASPETMLETLRAVSDTFDSAMIIGHQPGLGAMARVMSNGVSARCRRAFEHFPTAAAAVLEIGVDDWKAVGYGTAKFVDFAKPRELMDA